jgi:hypothetical protein
MIAMVFKAIGLAPRSRFAGAASRLAWWAVRYETTRLARVAA